MRLVVVLGHTKCGAVTAAVEALDEGAEPDSPSIGRILRKIAPHVLASKGEGREKIDEAARRNVAAVVAELAESAPVLAPLTEAGELKIVGAMYDLASGQVECIK